MTSPTPEPTEPDQSRRRSVLLAVGGVVFVIVATYVGLALFTGDRVPRGTTIADVHVGGLAPDDAEEQLASELGPRLEQPIEVVADDAEFEVSPQAAGLSLDVAATVEQAHGSFSLNPARVFHVVFGGQEVEPVVRVDEAKLEAVVAKIAKEVDQDPKDGAIKFADGSVDVTAAEPGRVLARDRAANQIRAAFLDATEPVELPVDKRAPAVGEDQVQQAMREFVEPALSGPVSVETDEGSFEIAPEQIAQALTMKPVDGTGLQPKLGPKKLAKALKDELAEVAIQPRDATVRLESGGPTVVPARDGKTVDPKALSEAVLAVLPQSDDRSVSLELTEKKADRTTKDAQELGIKEVVGEFTTTYPHAEYRNTNIGRAAELIDGTVLEPGDVFSLNGIVGERTEANGFTHGSVIEGGRLVNALGGGVSQLATTTYNAAFYAGLEDIEHRPHAFYISRYPAGREATVYWGSIDLRFGNNTPYGVLVDAKVDRSSPGGQGTLTVRLWSTDYWTVEESSSDRYNFRSPSTIYDDSEGCVPQGGSNGFDIDITRRVYHNGEHAFTDDNHWAYRAEDRIICGPDPRDSEDDSDDSDENSENADGSGDN